jgi:hypothetical protein
MQTVDLELVRTALEKVDGANFEKFANAAFAELTGPDYIPLGGVHDWGADGVLSTVQTTPKPNIFLSILCHGESLAENSRYNKAAS